MVGIIRGNGRYEANVIARGILFPYFSNSLFVVRNLFCLPRILDTAVSMMMIYICCKM